MSMKTINPPCFFKVTLLLINMPYQGVIFDMDGTLTEFNLDVKAIKEEILGRDTDSTILQIIESLDGPEKEKAEKILKKYELLSAQTTNLNPGVTQLLDHLDSTGRKRYLITRNNMEAAMTINSRFALGFKDIISREVSPPKPAPDQIFMALEKMGLGKKEVVFVGDHSYDILAARSAGVKMALLDSRFARDIPHPPDYFMKRIDELIKYLDDGH